MFLPDLGPPQASTKFSSADDEHRGYARGGRDEYRGGGRGGYSGYGGRGGGGFDRRMDRGYDRGGYDRAGPPYERRGPPYGREEYRGGRYDDVRGEPLRPRRSFDGPAPSERWNGGGAGPGAYASARADVPPPYRYY